MASFYRVMPWLASTEPCLALAREVTSVDPLSLGTGTKAWPFAPDLEQLCPQFPGAPCRVGGNVILSTQCHCLFLPSGRKPQGTQGTQGTQGMHALYSCPSLFHVAVEKKKP